MPEDKLRHPYLTDKRLARILENSASEAYVFDSDSLQFIFVNREARANLRYTMEELAHLTPWDLKPEFTREAFLQFIAPLRDGRQERLVFDTVHRRKDGSVYDVAVRLQLLRDDGSAFFFAAIQDVSERRRNEKALIETTRRLDAILNNTTMAIFVMDDRQHCVFMNKAAEELTGFTLSETQDRPLHDVIHHTYPDGRPFPLSECAIDRAFPEDNQMQGEEVFVHKDGSFYPVGFTASPIRDEAGRAVGTIIEVRDISEEVRTRKELEAFNKTLSLRVSEAVAERHKAEAQLFQAQKMEAIGKLTGGVAHDFNNALQVIGGNLNLLMKDLAGNERAEGRLHNALAGVSRGSKLAAQLLAFGRRQPLEPKAINVGRLLRNMDDMLGRALDERIEIETVVSGGLWNCFVDPTQIENVILNLAINSRDAITGQGKLTIEACNACLDDDYATQHNDVTPGQYVMIAVTDTGHGMTADVIERAFEPFYSTKPEGEGTGLGLSMAYGFVKQSGGHIKIYSEPGQGTTVRIYLPRTRREEESLPQVSSAPAVAGTETVLLVEDDEPVRATVADMLRDLGYKVLTAKNADSALAIVESGASIDLLFTDVVMPGTLRSPELARITKQRLPDVAVLFTSGYTQNAIVHAGRLDDGVELLSKPYNRDVLARRVRQVLDRRQKDPGSTAMDGVRKALETAPEPRHALSILLVEDEFLIRMTAAEELAGMGHRVHEAGRVSEARALLGEHTFDVLVTDISLPDGSGRDLAAEAIEQHADLFVIVASGREFEPLNLESGAASKVAYLAKPYDEQSLAKALALVTKRNDPA